MEKKAMKDLFDHNPQIKTVKLDVQQRNKAAMCFYENFGFKIVSEEYQPVGVGREAYYNL